MCHDPHLTAAEKDDPDDLNDVCLSCHSHEEHSSHPFGSGTVDPVRGGEVVCASCHDPHGSGHEQMLIDESSGKLCIKCHTGMIREKR